MATSMNIYRFTAKCLFEQGIPIMRLILISEPKIYMVIYGSMYPFHEIGYINLVHIWSEGHQSTTYWFFVPWTLYVSQVIVQSNRHHTVLVVYVPLASSGHCQSAIALEYNSPSWSAQTCILCSAPSEKREGHFLHAILAFSSIPSPVCALLASAGIGHVCGSGSPAFIAGGAPCRRIWPIVHGGAALFPLSPSARSPHCEDLGPPPLQGHRVLLLSCF